MILVYYKNNWKNNDLMNQNKENKTAEGKREAPLIGDRKIKLRQKEQQNHENRVKKKTSDTNERHLFRQ